MGKKSGGNSWFTAVKRAFRSPTKDSSNSEKNGTSSATGKSNTSRRREEPDQEEEEKKREKRRWLFRKASSAQQVASSDAEQKCKQESSVNTAAVGVAAGGDQASHVTVSAAEQRHAIAVAVATAEAAMATARAAVEVVRLTRPANSYAEHYDRAAVVIQTAFRGYLARRALRALKGLVKLQALVRGHNVRKQAKMTLQCMQALVRVQTRVRDQRMRLSQDGSRASAISDTNSLFESRYYQDIAERLSISREGSRSSIADDWDDRPHTIEEIQAMLQKRKESALKREKALAQAFSNQIWRSGRNPSVGTEEELEERPKWLDRWMATKPWGDSRARASTDQRDPIKTVEVDTSRPYAYSTPSIRRSSQPPQYHSSTIGSPMHRTQQQLPPHQHPRLSLHHHHSPITPSPSKTRPIQVRSASPRCGREDRANPNYPPQPYTPSSVASYYQGDHIGHISPNVPNYMAATESAKARIRSQSAPRVRPATPERDGGIGIGNGNPNASAKKRLSFPAQHEGSLGSHYGDHHSLRSPSFKSAYGGRRGNNNPMEQESNLSSYYTTDRESLGGGTTGGEISPSSTSELRRWLR